MNMQKTYLLVVLTLLVGTLGQLQSAFTTTQSGYGTYYGGTTGGNCGYGTLIPSWASSLTLVAMNQIQYTGNYQSEGCGMCVSMNGTGSGSGATPVSTFTAYVTDRCPECGKGSIDIGKSGDGRWAIEWKAITCPVGSYKIQYKFQGSNSYYIKVQVVGHSIPIENVNFIVNGKYYAASRTQDNFWNAPSSMSTPFSFPLTVQLISLDGQKLTDIIPNLANDVLISGQNKVQFASYGSGRTNLADDTYVTLNSSETQHSGSTDVTLYFSLGIVVGLVASIGLIVLAIFVSRKEKPEHV